MDLFDRAVCFALEKHSGQTRKTSKAPYILHPMESAAIAGTITDDKEILAACVLHDVLEDTGTTAEELAALFGERVTKLVLSETEDKRRDRPASETWETRKEESLKALKETDDIAVKIVWLGDKLSNMRSYAREYAKKGNALWDGFHQKDPRKQFWLMKRTAELLSELKDYPAYREMIMLMQYVFRDYLDKE